jgi:uncharacterized protein YndB with AHSA1/START domain
MTVLEVHRDPVALTLTIVSRFDAATERVWQVWADPRQLERWWGPPTFPATVIDHELKPGGRVTYYMTGPSGEKNYGWWSVISVDAPRSLEFEAGCADESGSPTDELPTISVEVRLMSASPDATIMRVTTRYASMEDMEKSAAMGQDEGMTLALGQINAILTTGETSKHHFS